MEIKAPLERIKVNKCEECPYDDCISQKYWGDSPKKIYKNCSLKLAGIDILYNHKIYVYD